MLKKIPVSSGWIQGLRSVRNDVKQCLKNSKKKQVVPPI